MGLYSDYRDIMGLYRGYIMGLYGDYRVYNGFIQGLQGIISL